MPFAFLMTLIFSSFSFATVFYPHTIQHQIGEADGIIQGKYLKSRTIELNGSLVTQMIFKVDEEVGLDSKTYKMEEVIIHYPGGSLGGMNVRVDGVPEFRPGERVALMVKNGSDRYWGMNLGFGAFKIINYGHEEMLINTIFPKNPKIGQMKMSDFRDEVAQIKGKSFNKITEFTPVQKEAQRLPASVDTDSGKKRTIASYEDQDENTHVTSGLSMAGLAILLALIGGVYRIKVRRF